jgi:predicted porin
MSLHTLKSGNRFALSAALLCFLLLFNAQARAQDESLETAAEEEPEQALQQPEEDSSSQESPENTARQEEAALNEDPEAQRRTKILEEPELADRWPTFELYGSVRIHAINNFNEQNELTEFSLGDGASRVGARAEWQFTPGWWLFGRAEGGFDVLDTFTSKGSSEEDGGGLEQRLLFGGLQSEYLMAIWGKNWSTYYQIAGMADRFSIFGGQAVGIYNAGTDGGATGTGRADDVLQARIYTSSLKALKIKPFNLNVQYQNGQPIPHVQGRNYGKSYGASAWLESESDHGMGIAVHASEIPDLDDPLIKEAGIDEDATALAFSFRKYGERWYSALVIARLENINTTDQKKYISGNGAELYLQWQFKDRWWMVTGGNWFKPDSDDPEAGEFEVANIVLGLRYTLDSFNRMLYAEYRLENGRLHDGTPRKSELTLGFRWDFGY